MPWVWCSPARPVSCWAWAWSSPAVYLMMVYISIPALMEMGASPISAHFFVFMFCVVAAITPPVGLALYVASGIARANVMTIGWKSIRLGVPLFIIPFFHRVESVPVGPGFGRQHHLRCDNRVFRHHSPGGRLSKVGS